MSRPQVTGAASTGSDGHLGSGVRGGSDGDAEGAGPDLLAGRYRLERRIAVGGMGEVWRAEDTVLGRAVAVKTLKSEYVDDPDFRDRFRAEARSAARLSHPGIASVHDYGEEPGRAFLVMELVDGEPLSTILRREGALPTSRALDLVQQTATALQAAHDGGVVHRDVKPGNLLVRPDGVVKVTDFGIASVADAVPLTRTGTVVGTAYYLSPEQASGGGVTAASDVYSLGVVAYECLAGTRPFPGDSPVAVAMAHLRQPPPPLPATVPAGVAALVMQALSKDPAARPGDAASLAAAVAALREALPAEAPGIPGVPAPALPVDPPSAVRPPAAEMVTQALPLVAGPVRPDDAADTADGARTAALSRAGHPHRSAHRRTLLSALALVVVLGLGLLLRSVLTAPDGTRVPEIPRGTTVSAAVAQLRDAELLPGRRTVTHPTVPRGLVLETDPPAGTARDRDSFVTLVVSGGQEPVTVDPASFLGRPLAEVSAELAALELRSVPAFDGSGTPAGTVSAMEPTGLLAPGSTVVLHVVPDAPAAPAPAPAPAAPAAPPAPAAPAPAEPAVPPGQAKDRPGPPQDKPGQGRR